MGCWMHCATFGWLWTHYFHFKIRYTAFKRATVHTTFAKLGFICYYFTFLAIVKRILWFMQKVWNPTAAWTRAPNQSRQNSTFPLSNVLYLSFSRLEMLAIPKRAVTTSTDAVKHVFSKLIIRYLCFFSTSNECLKPIKTMCLPNT